MGNLIKTFNNYSRYRFPKRGKMNRKRLKKMNRGCYGGIPRYTIDTHQAKARQETKSNKVNRKILFSLIIAIMAMTAPFIALTLSSPVSEEVPATVTYNIRSTIVINSDSEFDAAHGINSGSGAPGDPYVIDNWDITASTNHAITINNTRAYFEIRGCYLHGGSTNFWDGIIMTNVINGTIKSNVIQGNYHGVHLDVSNWNIIHANNISDNSLDGVYLDGCHDDSITNNSIWKNAWNGIFLSISNNNIVMNNTCNSNSWDGIYLETSSFNQIFWNNCSWNKDDGIAMYWNCISNFVFQNVVISNTDYGCEVDGGGPPTCGGNIITENTFMLNHGSLPYPAFNPFAIQGFDNNGPINFWDFGGIGNYWHDWTLPDADTNGIVDIPYLLDPAPYMAMDNFPLTNWSVIPEPPLILLSVIMLGICLLMARNRKKQ